MQQVIIKRQDAEDILWEFKTKEIDGIKYYSEDAIKILLDIIFRR